MLRSRLGSFRGGHPSKQLGMLLGSRDTSSKVLGVGLALGLQARLQFQAVVPLKGAASSGAGGQSSCMEPRAECC